MKIKREIKIGFTVIVAIAILVWGISFLKGNNVFDTGDRFYGVYSRVEGLTEGSPVFFKGYKIGTVQEISFHPSKEGVFLVAFSINKVLNLPDNTVAQIYSLDLMGSKGVQFLPGSSQQLLEPGDTLVTNVMGDLKDQVSMEVLPLKDKTEKLLVKLDTVLTNISRVFSEENKKGLSYGIKNFYLFMENLEAITAKLDATLEPGGSISNSLANIDTLSHAFKMQRGYLDSTMNNLSAFSGQLKEMRMDILAGRVDSTLESVNRLLVKAESGQGSLGMLLSDNALYLNLMDASANLDRLLADVRHNPGRYLHFSAIDLAPKMYVEVDDQKAQARGIVFKVQVARASSPLPYKNQMVMNQYRIFEDTDGKDYIYTIGESNSYREILILKDQIVDEFPDAEVIALENGKPIRLKKALKKIS